MGKYLVTLGVGAAIGSQLALLYMANVFGSGDIQPLSAFAIRAASTGMLLGTVSFMIGIAIHFGLDS